MADVNEYGYNNVDDTSSHPGAVRRVLHKVKGGSSSSSHSHGSKASYVDDIDGQPQFHPQSKTEQTVDTVGFALIQSILQYVKGPEGEAALEVILRTQSRVAASLAASDGARQSMRIAAEEAMKGSYDAAQNKGFEMFRHVPASLVTVVSVVLGSYVVLVSVGVLFSLWRFALFGFQ